MILQVGTKLTGIDCGGVAFTAAPSLLSQPKGSYAKYMLSFYSKRNFNWGIVSLKKHCCETLTGQVNYRCEQHENPFECPDNLIYYSEKFDEYGLICHGSQSYSLISYCPWCGGKLPDSKRDLWFDTLEEMGFDDPVEQDIPEAFKSDKWYRSK